MKKIMILGSGGMLGHMVYYHLNSLSKYQIVDSSFPTKLNENSKLLNVTNKKELEDFIQSEKPDIVINCIGILIKSSKHDPSNAIYLNSYFPHQIANLLRRTGGKLIHVSTDCVFSGTKGAYTEQDFCDADDTYGRSKTLGEIINEIDITLRTSIIGPEIKKHGEGLFHWFMQQNGEINGFTEAFWGGVTTLELAKVIDAVIEQNIIGLIHITNGKRISKYDLLSLFKNIFNKNKIRISVFEGKKVDKSLISIRNDFDYKVPSYEDMVLEIKKIMKKNKKLYSETYNF